MDTLFLLLASFNVATIGALKIVTFNTGLTPDLLYYEERAAAAPSTIASIDADILCLQELWYTRDMLAIIKASNESYPHSYSFKHSQLSAINESLINHPACQNPKRVMDVSMCVYRKCSRLKSGIEILACADENCTESVSSLNQECITCLLMTGLKNFRKCLTMNTDANALLVLSKVPINATSRQRFIPKTKLYMPRGYLQVDIKDFGSLICTHLTADFGRIYAERANFKSDKDQQLDEILKLLKVTDDILDTSQQKTVILAGDLNMGPPLARKHISAGYVSNYQMLTNSGYQDKYFDDVADCTWCGQNPLTPNDNLNLIYDHVMVTGLSRGFQAKRILKKSLPGHNFPLSDHYGVLVDVCKKSFWRILMEYVAVHVHHAYRYLGGN